MSDKKRAMADELKRRAGETYKGKSLKPGGGGQFAKLRDKLAAKGAENPEALAAFIGRKKLGKKKFDKLSAQKR